MSKSKMFAFTLSSLVLVVTATCAPAAAVQPTADTAMMAKETESAAMMMQATDTAMMSKSTEAAMIGKPPTPRGWRNPTDDSADDDGKIHRDRHDDGERDGHGNDVQDSGCHVRSG